MIKVLIVGSGASIFDYEYFKKYKNIKLTTLSSSSSSSDIKINWSNINSILKVKENYKFDLIVFFLGKWSSGRIKNLNIDLLYKMISNNVLLPLDIFKTFKKKLWLNKNTKIILISSESTVNTDFTAPEYSYSKLLYEKVFIDFCSVNKIHKPYILRPPFILDSKIEEESGKIYGDLLERKVISKSEFMISLKNKIIEIFKIDL